MNYLIPESLKWALKVEQRLVYLNSVKILFFLESELEQVKTQEIVVTKYF